MTDLNLGYSPHTMADLRPRFGDIYAELLRRWLPEQDLDTKVKWLRHYLFVDPPLNLLEDGFLAGQGEVDAALFRLAEIHNPADALQPK